jgi:AraC-like DNA-binding protein
VLSHPSVNVSVETGDHPRFGFALPAVLVHGVVTRRFTVDLIGTGRVTAVKFRPGGFRALTGVLPGRNSVAPLRDELGVAADDLRAAVLAEDDDADRAAALDAALVPHAREPEPAYVDLLALLDRMIDDRALVRVEQVAELGAMSARSLQRLFAGYLGVSPKAVLARYRLQDAAALIDSGQVDDLAALAADLGWFDQAHFSRDFRAVVGMPPSAYLQGARRLVPSCGPEGNGGLTRGHRQRNRPAYARAGERIQPLGCLGRGVVAPDGGPANRDSGGPP